MALDEACLFPAGMDDLMDDPILCSPDFLQFLGESDLTGPLPTIPEAPASPEVTSSVTAVALQPAVTTASPSIMLPHQQPAAVALQYCGTLLHPQQPLLVPQQTAQLQPSRAASCSSIDASAGRVFSGSVPGSPVSSPAPTSSSDISSLPAAHNVPRASAAGEPAAKRHRLQQGRAAAAAAFALQPQQQQQQPLSLPPQQQLTKQQIAANKRRAPEIDWRAIDDPAERRRQRRLAKNRVTAARSRERKKEQLAGMEERMESLEQENAQMRALLASLSQENASLKEQLASLTRGAAVCPSTTGSGPEPAVLKCIAIMHLAACLVLSVRETLRLVFAALAVGWVQQWLLTGAFHAGPMASCADSSLPAVAAVCIDRRLQRLQNSRNGRGVLWDSCSGGDGGVSRPRLKAAVGNAVAVAA